MNLIADRLFALMLGWTKALFNGLWNVLTNDTGSFAGVLQRLWLPLIVLILAFGTLVDYVIWLVRWRPYYVWGAWLRKRMARRRLNRTRNYMEDLDHSPLDLPEYQDNDADGQPVFDEPVYFDFQAFSQPVQKEQAAASFNEADPPPQFVPVLPWETVQQVPVLPEEHLFQPVTEQEATDPWVQDSPATTWQQDLSVPERNEDRRAQPPMPTYAVPQGNGAPRRRRRVESKHQRSGRVLQSLVNTFFVSDEDHEPVDSLQPPVTQEEAFHKPYYPQNYVYREQRNPTVMQDDQPE